MARAGLWRAARQSSAAARAGLARAAEQRQARAAAPSKLRSGKGRDLAGSASRNPRRHHRRGGKLRLKVGFSSAAPGRKTKAPNMRFAEAVRAHSTSPGFIHRERSGGQPAEPARRQPRLIPKNSKKTLHLKARDFERVVQLGRFSLFSSLNSWDSSIVVRHGRL